SLELQTLSIKKLQSRRERCLLSSRLPYACVLKLHVAPSPCMESVGCSSGMLDDSNAELFIKQCTLQLSPLFWSGFSMELPTIDVLYMLMNSVRQLKVALMPEAQEGFEDHSVRQSSGVNVFLGSVCLEVPQFLSTLVEKLCMKAFLSWSLLPKHEDEGIVSQDILVCGKFKELVTLLHSAGLFDTLMAFPLKQFVQKQRELFSFHVVRHILQSGDLMCKIDLN
ncbi:hypothetical protein GBAR_LOCUS29745, partial [Geodia barretti]